MRWLIPESAGGSAGIVVSPPTLGKLDCASNALVEGACYILFGLTPVLPIC